MWQTFQSRTPSESELAPFHAGFNFIDWSRRLQTGKTSQTHRKCGQNEQETASAQISFEVTRPSADVDSNITLAGSSHFEPRHGVRRHIQARKSVKATEDPTSDDQISDAGQRAAPRTDPLETENPAEVLLTIQCLPKKR